MSTVTGWLPVQVHAGENTGDIHTHVIFVEFEEGRSGPAAERGSDLPESTDLPRAIGAPVSRALHSAGCTPLDQLSGVPRTELAEPHGVGPDAPARLQAALVAGGLTPS